MYYEPYEQKILKLARIRDKIYRLRFLILGIFLAIVAAVVGLLSCKGRFFSGVQLGDRYEYGESFSPSANAFLAKAEYEYFCDGSWTAERPVMPGEYLVRAKAKKGFGGLSYSEEKAFTITKKPLSVRVADSTVYGNDPALSVDGLIAGDTLAEGARFSFGDVLTDSPWVALEEDGFAIVGEKGEVTTAGYALDEDTFGKKSIKLLPRPITLVTSGAEKTYDGEPLRVEEWSILEGELIPGDLLSAQCVGEQLLAGESKNDAEIALTNENGEDISVLYSVKVRAGVLKVTKRQISVTTASAEKLYDGTALWTDKFTLTGETKTVANEFLQATGYSQLVDAGEVENALTLAVFTEDGEDRTNCYAIAFKNGRLKVTPRKLVLTFGDDEKTYDGIVYADDKVVWGASGDGLADGETMYCETGVKQNGAYVLAKDAGEYVLTVKGLYVTDGNTDKTHNYELVVEEGRLEIFRRDLVIYLNPLEKIYDSFPYSVNDGGSVYTLDPAYPLADEETDYLSDLTAGDIADAGFYENVVCAEVRICDFERDTTHNYRIVTENSEGGGSLTIVKRAVCFCLMEKEKPYDGKALKSNEYAVYTGKDFHWPVMRHKVTLTAEGSITDVGETENVVTGVQITQDGVDVTYNYEISTKDSVLRVVKRMVKIAPLPYRKIYDGAAVDYEKELFLYSVWTREEDSQYGSSLLAGDTLYGEIEGGVAIDAGQYLSYVVKNTVRIVNGQGRDVTNEYYEVTVAEGTVEISVREIYVESRDVEGIYTEGTALKGSAEDCRIVKGSLVNGDTIEYEVTAQLDGVGSRVNRITAVIVRDKNGEIKGKVLYDEYGNKTEGNESWLEYNYRIHVTCGTLTLYPEKVVE